MALSLLATRFDDPTVTTLTAASVAEMASFYGGRGGSGAPPHAAEFEPPLGVFLLAELDGEAVGCGGLCRFDEASAEIRRIYVVPKRRGTGVAQALLDELLARARAAGYSRVRLETGFEQRAALSLYERAGFARFPCWGPYATDERSVCLELVLKR